MRRFDLHEDLWVRHQLNLRRDHGQKGTHGKVRAPRGARERRDECSECVPRHGGPLGGPRYVDPLPGEAIGAGALAHGGYLGQTLGLLAYLLSR